MTPTLPLIGGTTAGPRWQLSNEITPIAGVSGRGVGGSSGPSPKPRPPAPAAGLRGVVALIRARRPVRQPAHASDRILPCRSRCLATESVQGFGCRPRTAVPRIPAAGVRRPPGEETAIGEGVAAPRALWGFERSGWGFGVRIARLVGRIIDLSAYHRRVVDVCDGIERWRSAARWRPAWPIRASAATAGREPANTAGSIVAL